MDFHVLMHENRKLKVNRIENSKFNIFEAVNNFTKDFKNYGNFPLLNRF